MAKSVIVNNPVHYIEFPDGERVLASEIRMVLASFEYEETNELRRGKIIASNDVLALLVKYGYLKAWRNRMMIPMYSTRPSLIALEPLLYEPE